MLVYKKVHNKYIQKMLSYLFAALLACTTATSVSPYSEMAAVRRNLSSL